MTPDQRENRDSNLFLFGVIAVFCICLITGIAWPWYTHDLSNAWPLAGAVIIMIAAGSI